MSSSKPAVTIPSEDGEPDPYLPVPISHPTSSDGNTDSKTKPKSILRTPFKKGKKKGISSIMNAFVTILACVCLLGCLPHSSGWTRYIGITIDWDYKKRQVHLSMPGYVAKALKQFGHEWDKKKQDAPFPSAPIKYGAKKQYATKESTAPPLDKQGKKFIQQVCGKFLYLGRAVDSSLLCPISAIASQSAQFRCRYNT